MKKLKDFTDTEKIEIFDNIWNTAKEEFNESAKNPDEHDEHNFWEEIIEEVLKIDEKDWDRHNEGKIVK